MNAKDFLTKLERVKPNGENHWMAQCPAHTDGTASLSIKDAGDKLLLKCHAGCENRHILEKMGLKFGDLFSKPLERNGDHAKIVATYDYVDEGGDLLFQCVRFDPKDFRQRHKEGDKWVWNLKGVRIVPYRLNECVTHAGLGMPIHIVEGEKDANILWDHGFPATCNPMGAGKWRDDFTTALKDTSRFVVLADNDKPGREHAVAVAKSVSERCPDVRLGVMPNVNGHKIKDVSDWFSSGGTKEQFAEISAALPRFNPDDPFPVTSALHETFTIKELMVFDSDHDENGVVGFKDGKTTRYLCKGYGAWFIGQSGLGKSSLAIQQAVLWGLGRPFFGTAPIRPLRILFVESENDRGDMAEPLHGILNSIPITPDDVNQIDERVVLKRCRGLSGRRFFDWLEKEIANHRADIAYVDPLLRFAGIEISRTEQCTILVNEWIDPVLARTGAILMGIHHTGKPKQDRPQKGMTIYDYMYSGIGSSELVNWARAVSVLMPISDGMFEVKLAKRGRRAWATHPNGEITTSLFLKHHPEKIFWLQTDQPDIPETNLRPGGRPSQVDSIAAMNLFSFCNSCKPEGEGLNEIARRLAQWLAKEKQDASVPTCKRAVAALVSNQKLTKTDQLVYVKGPQA